MEIYHAQTYLASAQVQAYHAYIWHISQVHIFIIQKLKISNQEKKYDKNGWATHTESTEFASWKMKKCSPIFHSSPLPHPSTLFFVIGKKEKNPLHGRYDSCIVI